MDVTNIFNHLDISSSEIHQALEESKLFSLPPSLLCYNFISLGAKSSTTFEIVAKHLFSGEMKLIRAYSKARLISHNKLEPLARSLRIGKQLGLFSFSLFQDELFFYTMSEFSGYPSLQDLIKSGIKLSENDYKFIALGVLDCLQVLHDNGLILMDLSPKSIGFDQNGFPVILSFKSAVKINSQPNFLEFESFSTFLAPEILLSQPVEPSADLYSLGAILHSLLFPALHTSPSTLFSLFSRYFQSPLQISKDQIPEGLSLEFADFINRLIQPSETSRLGVYSVREVKEHPWLGVYKKKYQYRKDRKEGITKWKNVKVSSDVSFLQSFGTRSDWNSEGSTLDESVLFDQLIEELSDHNDS